MGVYDLRIYQVASGEMPSLERVLRELTLPMMPEYGMTPVGFWTDEPANRLYQISAHDSLAAIDGNWERFHADPRWTAGLKQRRGDRSAVLNVTTTRLTDIGGLPPSC